jgi:hypothetical protein
MRVEHGSARRWPPHHRCTLASSEQAMTAATVHPAELAAIGAEVDLVDVRSERIRGGPRTRSDPHPARAFVGAGPVFAGLTDICAMGLLLARMPWNRSAAAGAACALKRPSG